MTTFHSFARKIIGTYDTSWWKLNSVSEDFWELDVPVKLEEYLPYYQDKFDAIIIDEGQDFKELWFELIFSLGKKDASKHVFMDQMQDIFGHYTKIPMKRVLLSIIYQRIAVIQKQLSAIYLK